MMDELTALDAGDDVRITTEREGEELEITAHVTDAHHEQPERLGWGWNSGKLTVRMDADNETVDRLDIATHSLDIHGDEPKPGEWKRVIITAWDPVVEDGEAVRDEWMDLGDITDVERLDS